MSLKRLQADIETKDEVAKDNANRIMALREEVINAKKFIQNMPPQTLGRHLLEDFQDTAREVWVETLALRTKLEALRDLETEHGVSYADVISGYFALVQRALVTLREDFDVKDAPGDSDIPAWLNGLGGDDVDEDMSEGNTRPAWLDEPMGGEGV